MAFNSHIIGSMTNPGPTYVRGGKMDKSRTIRGRPVRFHLALLRMRENKGLRRIAALANAVGLTHLAQGGAQLGVKLGVIGASTSSETMYYRECLLPRFIHLR